MIDNIKISTAKSIFFKATLLSLFFTFIMLFVTALVVGAWGFFKINNFAHLADTNLPELKTTLEEGWNKEVTQTNFKKNFLILGLDTLDTRPGSPALTDTILLLSLDLKTGEISSLPLPRDLWSQEFQTRINALYFYGQERYPEKPEEFAEQTISELAGIKIHHTIVLSMNAVAKIVDIFEGVEIDVEHGFTDTEFPVSNVNVTEVSDPKILYQTIIFEKGEQTMNGERVLQFIRSRKSGDNEGDDLARAKRQQLVISSLIKRVKSFSVLRDEKILAALYKFYDKDFSKQFSIQEGLATLKTIFPLRNSIEFSSGKLSVYPDSETGVITNPPTYKYKGEWVYEIIDINLFRSEVHQNLNL